MTNLIAPQISILIISVENKNIKTEKIYFANKKKLGLSLKYDKEFLKKELNIKDLFFEAFDINSSKKFISQKLQKLRTVNPKIEKVFVICDRDIKSVNDQQIKEAINMIKKVLKKIDMEPQEINYLKYEKENNNFETFLKLHNKEFKLPNNYSKTDNRIYEKIMGKNGKNFIILKENINQKNSCKEFLKLFKKHQGTYD